MSFVFDEVVSFQLTKYFEWTSLGDHSNNHYLNTALMKLSKALFGNSELALRLPNVLAFILYLTYAAKIGGLFNKRIRLYFLILLTAMPFLLDFFSLARGYGLCLAFMLCGIYFLIKYIQNFKLTYLIITLLTGTLGVLCNFTLLNYFLPFVGTLILFIILSQNNRRSILLHLGTSITIVSPFLIILVPIMFELKANNHLYYGGRTAFFYDLISSFGRCLAYGQINVLFVQILFGIVFFISMIFSFINLFSVKIKQRLNLKSGLSILFLLAILSPILQHLFFGTNFPVERTALTYYPLMIIAIVIGIKKLKQSIIIKTVRELSVLMLVLFLLSANSNSTYTYRFDSDTKKVALLMEESQNLGKKHISIGVSYTFNPSIHYYLQTLKLNSLEVSCLTTSWAHNMGIEELNPYYYGVNMENREAFSNDDAKKLMADNFDYYYLHDYYLPLLIEYGYNIKVIQEYHDSNSVLFKIVLPVAKSS